ncbi:hypothetical protein K502DRAFT_344427 [Neoconidiobolus thromboides FSU 785]|nr:hypothetical protein K502DRAFT_344427 [Neoconidiobolus thromboides FSU 785]
MAYRGNKNFKNGRGFYSNHGGVGQSNPNNISGNHGPSQGPSKGRGGKWNHTSQYPNQGQNFNISQQHQYQPNNPPIDLQANFPPPQQKEQNPKLGSTSESPEAKVARIMHERTMFLLSNMIGQKVGVSTVHGDSFEGLFEAATVDTDLGVALQLSKKVNSTEEENDSNDVLKQMIFLAKDLECIEVENVDFNPPNIKEAHRRQSFRTDTGISGHSGEVYERELVSWVPDENIPDTTGSDINNQFLDENGKWDQFAANKALFNVETNYDELIYTTKIDRSAPNFAEVERNAERIANEILNKSSSNPHISEERGHQTNNDEDEEEKYSAVARAIKEGKYVPPSVRAKYQQVMQAKGQEAQTTSLETQPKAGTAQPSAQINPLDESKKVETSKPATINQPTAESNESKDLSKKSNTARFLEAMALRDKNLKHAMAAEKHQPLPIPTKKVTTGQPISQKKADAILQLFSSNKLALSIPTQKKLLGKQRASKPIEEELMGTFRQFVSTEKERVKLGQQAKIKKDKDGKVAELLKFSQTFKLKTPVPSDIKDIISKGNDNKTGDHLPAISEKSEDDAKSETSSVKASAKLNVKAPEFKPNPSAKPFNPNATIEAKKEVNAFFLNGKPEVKEDVVDWQFEVIEQKVFNDPSTQAPTWPTEGKPYRQQFNVTHADPQYPNIPPNMYPQPPFYPAYRYPNQMPYPQMMGIPPQGMPYMNHPQHNPPPPYPYPQQNNQPMLNHPSPGPTPQNYYNKQPHENSNNNNSNANTNTNTNTNTSNNSDNNSSNNYSHSPQGRGPSQPQQPPPQPQGPPQSGPQGTYMGAPNSNPNMMRYAPPNDPNVQRPNMDGHYHYQPRGNQQTPPHSSQSPHYNQNQTSQPPHTHAPNSYPSNNHPHYPQLPPGCSPYQHQPPFHPMGHPMGHPPPPQFYQMPPQHYHQPPNFHPQHTQHHPNHGHNPRGRGRGRGSHHNNNHNNQHQEKNNHSSNTSTPQN